MATLIGHLESDSMNESRAEIGRQLAHIVSQWGGAELGLEAATDAITYLMHYADSIEPRGPADVRRGHTSGWDLAQGAIESYQGDREDGPYCTCN
jgi:hypothetical protein